MDREDNSEKETPHSLKFMIATLLAVIVSCIWTIF